MWGNVPSANFPPVDSERDVPCAVCYVVTCETLLMVP